MNLSDIRKQYPQYDNVSDERLAKALHAKYYSHVEFNTFADKIGYSADQGVKVEPPDTQAQQALEAQYGVIRQPDKSNIFQEAGRGLKRGFYGAQETLGTALDVLGADNLGQGIAEDSRKQQSINRMDADISGNVIQDPSLLASPRWLAGGVAEAVPSLATAALPGGVAGGLAKAAGKSAKFAKYAGIITAGAAGGSMEGAGTYRTALGKGDSEGVALAKGATMATGSAILNSLSFGKMLSGKTKNKLLHAVIAGLTEGATEQAEEPLDAFLNNEDPVEAWLNGFNVFVPSMLLGAAGGAGGKYALDENEKAELETALDAALKDRSVKGGEKVVARNMLNVLQNIGQQKWDAAENEGVRQREQNKSFEGNPIMQDLGSMTEQQRAEWWDKAERDSANLHSEHAASRADINGQRLKEKLTGLEQLSRQIFGDDQMPALPKPDSIYQQPEAGQVYTPQQVDAINRYRDDNANRPLALPKPDTIYLGQQADVTAQEQTTPQPPQRQRNIPAQEQPGQGEQPRPDAAVSQEADNVSSGFQNTKQISEADHAKAYEYVNNVLKDPDSASEAYRYALQSFDPSKGTAFPTYAYMVADYVRRGGGKLREVNADRVDQRSESMHKPIMDGKAENGDRLSGEYIGEKGIINKLDIDGIKEAIKTLPEKQAQALELIYLNDMSQRDAAKEMGVSFEYVRKLHDKGIENLQKIYRSRANEIKRNKVIKAVTEKPQGNTADVTVQKSVIEHKAEGKEPWQMTRGNYYQSVRNNEGAGKSNVRDNPNWSEIKKLVGFDFVADGKEVQPLPKQRLSGGFSAEQEDAIKDALSGQGFTVDKTRVRNNEEQDIPKGGGWRARSRDVFPTSPEHERSVRKALSEGKPVPAEVLADYPDLQQKLTKEPAKVDNVSEKVDNQVAKPDTEKTTPQTVPQSKETPSSRQSVQQAPTVEPAANGEQKGQPEPEAATNDTTSAKKPSGWVWVKEQQRPFTSWREITRGKNKGKVAVNIRGREVIVDKSKVVQWPEDNAAAQKTDQPAESVRAETGEDSAAADDIRGYTYAIEKDGRVITSGGIPAMGDPTHETTRLEYYKNLAKQAGGKLYLGRKPGYKTQLPEEPLIMGKTWRQIQDMQQGKNIPETIKPTMPKDAALVYDASTDGAALDGGPTSKTGEPTLKWGEHIGGSRYDRANKRLGVEDLSDMNERERDKFVTKKNIWPDIDYAKLVENGVPAEVAWNIKKIKDATAIKPAASDKHEAYISEVSRVRDIIEGVKTIEDITGIFSSVFPIEYFNSRWTEAGREAARVLGGNKFVRAIQVGAWDISKAKREIAKTGWPAKAEAWRQGILIRQTSNGTWDIDKRIPGQKYRFKLLAEGLESKEAAERHLEEVLKPELIAQRAAAGRIERPVLENIERTMPKDYRKGRDVSPDELRAEFGFRGLESGKWNVADLQAYVNQAYDALHDLAEILRVPPKALSLNGELGLAFGARGGGWGSAHYEPTKVVINLTKTRGAGALAHEWGHAVDDYFGRMAEKKAYPKSYSSHGNTVGLRNEIRQAWGNINKVIRESREYWRGSTEMSKSVDSYWTRPHEMFARAFEAYVQDMAQEAGKSDYLVHDADNTRWGGKPYPEGVERENINAAMDEFTKALKTRKTDNGVQLYSGLAFLDPFINRGAKAAKAKVSNIPKISQQQRAKLKRVTGESVPDMTDKLTSIFKGATDMKGFDSHPAGQLWKEAVIRIETEANAIVGRNLSKMEKAEAALSISDRQWAHKNFKQVYEAEGSAGMPTAKLKAYADAWTEVHNDLGRIAEDLGVMVADDRFEGGRRPFTRSLPNFFPRSFTKEARDAVKRGRGSVFEAMVQAGIERGVDVKGLIEANTTVDDMRRFGHMENPRIGELPDTVTTKNGETVKILQSNPFDMIASYINGAAHRLAIIRELGQDEAQSIAEEVSTALKTDGLHTEGRIVDDTWAVLNGNLSREERRRLEERGLLGIVRPLESIARLAMLSTATVSQISGWVPMAARGGMWNNVKAMAEVAGEKAGRRIGLDLKSTAELDLVRNMGGWAKDVLGHTYETEDLEGVADFIAKKGLSATGFSASNRVLNQAASLTALNSFIDGMAYLRNPKDSALSRLWGKDAQSVRNQLKSNYDFTDSEIDRMIGNGIDYSDAQAIAEKAATDPKMQRAYLDMAQAVQRMVGKTNLYRESILNRPPWMNKRGARMFMTFLSYSRAMGRTLGYSMTEAKRGNLRPIVTLLAGGAIAGGVVDELKKLLFRKDNEPIEDSWDLFKRLMEYELEAATFGLWGVVAQDALWSYRLNDVSIDIPLVEWWFRNIRGVVKAIDKGDPGEIYKELARSTPIIKAIDAQFEGPLYSGKNGTSRRKTSRRKTSRRKTSRRRTSR